MKCLGDLIELIAHYRALIGAFLSQSLKKVLHWLVTLALEGLESQILCDLYDDLISYLILFLSEGMRPI